MVIRNKWCYVQHSNRNKDDHRFNKKKRYFNPDALGLCDSNDYFHDTGINRSKIMYHDINNYDDGSSEKKSREE